METTTATEYCLSVCERGNIHQEVERLVDECTGCADSLLITASELIRRHGVTVEVCQYLFDHHQIVPVAVGESGALYSKTSVEAVFGVSPSTRDDA